MTLKNHNKVLNLLTSPAFIVFMAIIGPVGIFSIILLISYAYYRKYFRKRTGGFVVDPLEENEEGDEKIYKNIVVRDQFPSAQET